MITIFQMSDHSKPVSDAVLEEQIERELLALITEHLKSGELELEKAQELSKEFLDLLPFSDKAEMLGKLATISPKYTEIATLYTKYASELERDNSSAKVTAMSEHIKNGNIEEALIVAKGGI